MREYKKILACVDLTDGSEQVAERAKDMAARCGGTVTLLHVVEYVPVEPMGEALLPAVQIEGELIERATKRIAELAARVGLDAAQRIVRAGNIKSEVVRIAQEWRSPALTENAVPSMGDAAGATRVAETSPPDCEKSLRPKQ